MRLMANRTTAKISGGNNRLTQVKMLLAAIGQPLQVR
jgi:hypothetical protein